MILNIKMKNILLAEIEKYNPDSISKNGADRVLTILKNGVPVAYAKESVDLTRNFQVSSDRIDEVLAWYNVVKCEGFYHPDTLFGFVTRASEFGIGVVMPALKTFDFDYNFLGEKQRCLHNLVFELTGNDPDLDIYHSPNWGLSGEKSYYHDLHLFRGGFS